MIVAKGSFVVSLIFARHALSITSLWWTRFHSPAPMIARTSAGGHL